MSHNEEFCWQLHNTFLIYDSPISFSTKYYGVVKSYLGYMDGWSPTQKDSITTTITANSEELCGDEVLIMLTDHGRRIRTYWFWLGGDRNWREVPLDERVLGIQQAGKRSIVYHKGQIYYTPGPNFDTIRYAAERCLRPKPHTL